MKSNPVHMIGIAGPSGSGKSTLARTLTDRMSGQSCMILHQDHYYRDQSSLSLRQRQRLNYDHPEALERSLLAQDLAALQEGHAIKHPVYDFNLHLRKKECRETGPADIVIVDGILIFAIPAVRELLNTKIYMDTPLDLCLIHRLHRDVTQRGRSVQSVIQQYLSSVRPMYYQYVLPSRQYADILAPGDEQLSEFANKVIAEIQKARMTEKT